MQKRSIHSKTRKPLDQVERAADRVNARSWLRLLGPVIYAARHDDMIKIGWTSNLSNRLSKLGGVNSLLAWQPGTLDDEQALHRSLTGHAIHGLEWYRLDDLTVLDVINQMRDRLSLPAII